MENQNQVQVLEQSRVILVPRAHVVNKERLFNFIRQNSVNAPARVSQQPSREGLVHQQPRNNIQRSQSMRPAQQHNNQPPPPEHQLNRNQSFRTPNRHIEHPGANHYQPHPLPPPQQSQAGPQFPQNQHFAQHVRNINSPISPKNNGGNSNQARPSPPPQQPQAGPQFPQYQHFQAPQHHPYPNTTNDHFAQHVRNINSPTSPKNNGGNSNSFLFSGNFDPNRAPARQVTTSVPLFGDNNNNRKRNNDDMFSPPPRKAPTPNPNRSQSSARVTPNSSPSNQGQQLMRNPLASSPKHLPPMREESSNRQSSNRPSRDVFYGGDNDYEDGSIFIGNQVNDAFASSMLGVSRRNNRLDGSEHHSNFVEEEPEEDEEENPNVFFREQGGWMAENLLNGEDLLDGLGGNLGGKAGGMVGAKLGKKLGNERAGEMLGEFAGDELGDMAGELAADAAMDALGEMEVPDGLPDGLEIPDVGLPDGLEKPDMDKLCKGCSIM